MNSNDNLFSPLADGMQPSDLSKFKESILLLFKEIESKIENKLVTMQGDLNSKLHEFENKFNMHDIRLRELTSSVNQDKVKVEKIDSLLLFQRKTNDSITAHDIKLASLSKDLNTAINKYDKMYLDNLIIPGTIGDHCKYRNLREYIESNITQVANLITYKEKHSMDLKTYKDKLDLIIQQFNLQINNYEKNSQIYANNRIGEVEAGLKELIKEVNIRMNDMRMENSKYAAELKFQARQISIDYDKLFNMRTEITSQLNESVKEIKEAHEYTQSNFQEYKIEFERIRTRFNEIAEFIKDVRFRKNLGADVTRSEMKKMAEKLTFDKKKSPRKNEHNDITELDKKVSTLDDGVKRDREDCIVLYEEENLNVEGDDNFEINFLNNEVTIENLSPSPKFNSQQILQKINNNGLILKNIQSENEIEKKTETSNNIIKLEKVSLPPSNALSPEFHLKKRIGINNLSLAEKKIAMAEKKIAEIENFTKKKLEELASQIKMFIPIHFNAYLKQREEKSIIALENAFRDTECPKKHSINILDPLLNSKLKEKEKEKNLNTIANNTNTHINHINLTNQVNLINTTNNFQVPNVKKKRVPTATKLQQRTNEENKKKRTNSRTRDRSMIAYHENYIPLSDLITRPRVKDDSNINRNIPSTLFMPLKNCLEQFEYLENKHQIISKLPK